MKRLIFFLFFLLPAVAWAINPYVGDGKRVTDYQFGSYFGGGDNALDGVDGNNLKGGEIAYVNYAYGTGNEMLYTRHVCRVGVNETEKPNNIKWIVPDNNPGVYPNNKIWYHIPAYAFGTATPPALPDDIDYIDRTAP